MNLDVLYIEIGQNQQSQVLKKKHNDDCLDYLFSLAFFGVHCPSPPCIFGLRFGRANAFSQLAVIQYGFPNAKWMYCYEWRDTSSRGV